MKIILGDFNAKMGIENIFKSTIRNESLHQDSNDKNWLLRAHSSHTKTFISTPQPLLMGRLTTRLITH